MNQVWCVGCDQVVYSDWMKFTDDGRYLCDRCRGESPKNPVMVLDLTPVEGPGLYAVRTGGHVELMTPEQYRERYVNS